jgi:hypothetical protein
VGVKVEACARLFTKVMRNMRRGRILLDQESAGSATTATATTTTAATAGCGC